MKAKLITRTVQTLTPAATPYDVRDSDMAGFVLRVTPTGSMTYFCDYRRPDGRRTRVKLGDASVLTPSQARDEARKVLGERAQGLDPASTRKAARQETLGAFFEQRYRPWVEAHRKSGTVTVIQTRARFTEFMDLQLSDVSPWKVEKWRAGRLKSGTAASTVNRNVTMLKAILQKAVEWDLIAVNPLAKVKPLKTDQAAKVRYLDADEEFRLREALDSREARMREERRQYNTWLAARHLAPYPNLDAVSFADYLKPMVLLSLNTGLRRGELFNLRWEDIDFQRQTLTVVGATAKSGKTRHIQLNRGALTTLHDWKAQAVSHAGLVFESSDGGRFNNVRKSWAGVLATAKIERFRWHDMRHHFASWLVMSGVDLNTVRELLGHGDIKMTLRYAHLAPQVKADAVAKLDGLHRHQPGAPMAASEGS